MTTPEDTDLPDDDDVVIWHVEARNGLDVYRVTKGPTVIGEYTGWSISSSVFQVAVEHVAPGRVVWLKEELRLRRLDLGGDSEILHPPPDAES
jgi:hypothetical protein